MDLGSLVETSDVAPSPRCGGPGASLENNPFDLVERNLIVAAIVKLGRARTLVRRHLLGVLEKTAVEQIDGDAGRPEAVATEPGEEPGFRSPVSCLRPRPPSVRNSGAFFSAARPAAVT